MVVIPEKIGSGGHRWRGGPQSTAAYAKRPFLAEGRAGKRRGGPHSLQARMPNALFLLKARLGSGWPPSGDTALCLLKAGQGSGWPPHWCGWGPQPTGAYAKRPFLAEGKAGNPLVGGGGIPRKPACGRRGM
jgi:hypothetical protein